MLILVSTILALWHACRAIAGALPINQEQQQSDKGVNPFDGHGPDQVPCPAAPPSPGGSVTVIVTTIETTTTTTTTTFYSIIIDTVTVPAPATTVSLCCAATPTFALQIQTPGEYEGKYLTIVKLTSSPDFFILNAIPGLEYTASAFYLDNGVLTDLAGNVFVSEGTGGYVLLQPRAEATTGIRPIVSGCSIRPEQTLSCTQLPVGDGFWLDGVGGLYYTVLHFGVQNQNPFYNAVPDAAYSPMLTLGIKPVCVVREA